jgi:hypothetical protein
MAKQAKQQPVAAPRQNDKVEIIVGVVIGILILVTWIVTAAH